MTKGEIQSVLGRKDAQEFCKWYGITAAGNFEGKSIPNLIANNRYEERNQQELAEAAPFTKDYPVPSEGTVYYLCKNGH